MALLTWTLKMSEDQAKTWDQLVADLAEEIGRGQVGRSKLTRKELVETLVVLARTDKTVRKRLADELRAQTVS